MLSIQFDSGNVRNWHIGEKNPVPFASVYAVQDIQADGDELEHIHNMFSNSTNIIPKGRVVRIFGDLAKTIIANL